MMDVPPTWNGTVLLFSHGYTSGPANPAQDAPDEATKTLLLQQGYALIGSSYATTGWAVTDAVPDQLATLDAFTTRFGQASRALAWGRSYGGLVTTAIAERHPEAIDGSLSLCGLVQGGVANWNLISGGINASGCSGSGSGFDCADWIAAGPGAALGGILTFVFDQTINLGTLITSNLGASIKAQYVDASGAKVGALVSEDITLQTSSSTSSGISSTGSTPEPGSTSLAVLGLGLLGATFWARRRNI
jgi:MYXO-CTERM domain-containing protein